MKKQTKCGNTRKTDTSWIGSYSNKKGITLISLVITIIILIILAAITINLTIGQRGILIRAQEAGRNYQEAAKQEDEMLKNLLDNEIDNCNQDGWTYVETYVSPGYPENYLNNCDMNVKKTYGEDIKKVLIVVRYMQVERWLHF